MARQSMNSSKGGDKPVLKVACKFGGYSNPGGKTVSLALAFKRDRNGARGGQALLSDVDLSAFLLESRVDVTMHVGSEEELLIKDALPSMSGTADIHTASMKREQVSCRLTFDGDNVDKNLLQEFTKRDGVIIVCRQGDAGEEPAGAATVGDE